MTGKHYYLGMVNFHDSFRNDYYYKTRLVGSVHWEMITIAEKKKQRTAEKKGICRKDKDN